MKRFFGVAASAALLLIPLSVSAQVATMTTGSQACAILAQSAANGVSSRIAADDISIKAPASVSKLSCLNNFFSGVGLDVVTSMLDPAHLLQAVEGQICSAATAAWNEALGSAQCGLTATGFNLNFGGLGGGTMCPRLSFGGGGPPLGSMSAGAASAQALISYMNGRLTTPTGYNAVTTVGSF